jgi:hypothetical protein
MQKQKKYMKAHPDSGSNRIFFIRFINRIKTAKSGYPKKKKSGLTRINPDTDRSTTGDPRSKSRGLADHVIFSKSRLKNFDNCYEKNRFS